MPVLVAKGVDAVLPRIIMGRVVKGGTHPNHLIFLAFDDEMTTLPDVSVVPVRIVLEAYLLQRVQVGRKEKWRVRGVIPSHSNPGGNSFHILSIGA